MESDVTMINSDYELNIYTIPRRPPTKLSLSVPLDGSDFGSSADLPARRKPNVEADSPDSFNRGKSRLEDDILVIA